jgi:hypothetical protein
MGKELWSRVKPSFRKLCNVLQFASDLTAELGKKRITIPILRDSCRTMVFCTSALTDTEDEEDNEEELPPGHSDAEEESERRQDAKRKRKHQASE